MINKNIHDAKLTDECLADQDASSLIDGIDADLYAALDAAFDAIEQGEESCLQDVADELVSMLLRGGEK